MDVQEERKANINKLERLARGIDKILELPPNRIVTFQIRDELENLREKANLLQNKLENNEFEIAVVGLEKAGKSSFANALADLQILPTADARCTYTSTCIRPGDSNSATVTFLTSDELNRDLKDKLQTLGIANAANWNLDNLSLQKYEQMFQDLPEGTRRLYGDNVNEDIVEMLANKESLRQYLNRRPRAFNEAEMESQEFKGFITDPARARAVKEIVIRSTKLKVMPNAVLYDVPGFDSPTAMHRQQTLEKMNTADAIIAVANAKAPSLTQTALDIFRESDAEGNPLSDKLFVFANKADLIADAQALAENMETTRQEWTEKRKILDPRLANRIEFGSAFAASGDGEARQKLERLGLTDGIQTFRDKLVLYNDNERFEVLKRRIRKLLVDVKKLFEATAEGAGPENGQNYDLRLGEIIGEIILELVDKLRPDLRERLNQLKYDMNKALDTERPLSLDIGRRISEMVSLDKFGLGDEETQRLHKELGGRNPETEMPTSLDAELRKKRFHKMYSAFCGQVQDSAVARHHQVSDDIRKLFMDALNVSPNQEGYEDLAREVDRFCGFDEQNDEAYYDSLLERFARDIFEILILHSQGQERLNKFKGEKPNYLSMGVFYDMNGGDAAASSPQESNFWRLLLYPELAAAPKLDDLLTLVKQGSGLMQIGKSVQKMLLRLAAQKGGAALAEVDQIVKRLPRGANEAVVASALKLALEAVVDMAQDDVDSVLEDGYLRDVQERRGNYTYKDVQAEFAADIDALRLALERAFIPAVDMEKAFGSRETRRMENIRENLLGDGFRKFIIQNIGVIEAARLGDLRLAESQRRADAAVMSEIRAILAGIDNASLLAK